MSEIFGPYLGVDTEKQLEIQFCEPGDYKEILDDTQKSIEDAARFFGEDTPEVVLPSRGLLLQELTDQQRGLINSILGKKYADINAAQQEELQRKSVIQESGEGMVNIESLGCSKELSLSFSAQPFHSACGKFAGKKRIWHVRKEVASRLQRLVECLNALGIKPHIEDCFRPVEVQLGLYVRRVVDIAITNPDWDWENVKKVVSSLTAASPSLAGHQAGAAIDLRLKNIHTDEFLPLGNDYAEGGALSCIHCPYITPEQFSTRMKFAHIARMGGFRLLPTEDWHISHGDRGMGKDGRVPTSVKYGPIKNFKRNDGTIRPYNYDSGEHVQLFLDDEMIRAVVTYAASSINKSDCERDQLSQGIVAWFYDTYKNVLVYS